MSVIALKEDGPVGEDLVQVFLVRQRFRNEHGVIPAAAKDPVISRVFRYILAQSLLNVRSVLGSFEIHAAKAQRAIQKMDVAVDESRENQFSAGIDNFRAHAAHFFDFGVVVQGNDLCAANGHGLSPRLLRIFGVDAPVNHDYVRRSHGGALRRQH